MSRYAEYQRMSAVITAAVRRAFQDNRGKRIAIAIGCAVITGKRIAASGRVGALYRRQLIETLDGELARSELEIRRLRLALRGIGDVATNSPAPAAVAADLLEQAGAMGARPAERAGDA